MAQPICILLPRRNLNYQNTISFHFPGLFFECIIKQCDELFSKMLKLVISCQIGRTKLTDSVKIKRIGYNR